MEQKKGSTVGLICPRTVKDLTGMIFERLTVTGYHGRDRQNLNTWKCQCECGKEIITRGSSLNSKNTTSCGCLRIERTKKACTTHGLSGGRKHCPRIYRIWKNMKSRCGNPKTPRYERYGGRGISVCEPWNSSYLNFYLWCVSSGYQEDLTLDRIDNDKGYSPDNCRWATMSEQGLNRSDNHLVLSGGRSMTIKEWSEVTGIKFSTISSRINDYGWTPERAVTLSARVRTI
jgi:hypothetical protein